MSGFFDYVGKLLGKKSTHTGLSDTQAWNPANAGVYPSQAALRMRANTVVPPTDSTNKVIPSTVRQRLGPGDQLVDQGNGNYYVRVNTGRLLPPGKKMPAAPQESFRGWLTENFML